MASHPDKADKDRSPATPAQGAQEEPQQFTPEELRKANRAQVILYVVMAVFIILPFVVLWLRKSGAE